MFIHSGKIDDLPEPLRDFIGFMQKMAFDKDDEECDGSDFRT
jgi:hypothetical protein